MLYFLRHTLAVLALPVTVVAIVPVWISRRYEAAASWPRGPAAITVVLLGIAVGLVGLGLFISTLRLFAHEGRGTLAPWDPPRHLVVRGPYRYVRNPMIAGVLFMLVGIALVLRSRPHAIWALLFLGINATYIPLLEEPPLEWRFGEEYREYRRHVPRFLPRLRPWSGGPAEAQETPAVPAASKRGDNR